MSENLPLKTPAISTWLGEAISILEKEGIQSARLDSEIILAHTLRKPRTYIHAHPEIELDDRQHEIADARLSLRAEHVPVAYIIGHKEFYGRQFHVTSATLIPRPESETIIDLLKEHLPDAPNLQLTDIGTGSGCLGITAKLELPSLNVTLSDVSLHALKVADKNARVLKADVLTVQSNLLSSISVQPDIILANLPYVDPSWERSPETQYEPEIALFADDNGLLLIKKLIDQSSNRLPQSGQLYIEADIRQHQAIIENAKSLNFKLLKQQGYILAFEKN